MAKQLSITFGGAKMTEIHRVDPASGHVKYACNLGSGFDALFKRMGWQTPGEKTKMEKLDGKLEGGTAILTSKDKLVDAEAELEYVAISDFELHRFEIEGRKKKGFRRELRFRATFKEQDACAKLEAYMMATDNGRGNLKVSYTPKDEQPELIDMTTDSRQQTLETPQ